MIFKPIIEFDKVLINKFLLPGKYFLLIVEACFLVKYINLQVYILPNPPAVPSPMLPIAPAPHRPPRYPPRCPVLVPDLRLRRALKRRLRLERRLPHPPPRQPRSPPRPQLQPVQRRSPLLPRRGDRRVPPVRHLLRRPP